MDDATKEVFAVAARRLAQLSGSTVAGAAQRLQFDPDEMDAVVASLPDAPVEQREQLRELQKSLHAERSERLKPAVVEAPAAEKPDKKKK